MALSAFQKQARRTWVEALRLVVSSNMPSSMTWRGASTIAQVLTPIMGSNNNHTHLPGSGGMDMQRVRPALYEAECLEFFPHESNNILYLMKPKRLTLEFIEHAPAESFFYLELDELEPTGIYPKLDEDDEFDQRLQSAQYEPFSEEVVEVGPHQYMSRSGWDDGLLPDGRDLPQNSRLVIRCFRGAAMPVTKGSLWNGMSETYDGRHNRMTPEEIRAFIERTLTI